MKKNYGAGEVIAHVERLGELSDDTERQSYLRSLEENSPQLASDVVSLFEESTRHSIFERMGKVAGRALAESDRLDLPDMQGQKIQDRYSIGEPIGEGATSRVYAATDNKTDRQVAVKCFPMSQEPRWRHEFGFLQAISHPMVLDLLDQLLHWHPSGTIVPCLVFRQHLALLPKNPAHLLDCLTRARAAYVELTPAIAQLSNDFHVVNRDIKPDNLYQWYNRILIGDFGVAVPTRAEGVAPAGTRGFAAPEIWEGATPSTQTEHYSVVATVYALLFGGLLGGRPPVYERMEEDLAKQFAPFWRRRLLRAFQAHLHPDPEARPIARNAPYVTVDPRLDSILQLLIRRERQKRDRPIAPWHRLGRYYPGSFQGRWF